MGRIGSRSIARERFYFESNDASCVGAGRSNGTRNRAAILDSVGTQSLPHRAVDHQLVSDLIQLGQSTLVCFTL
jgi:hypothetical protein